MLDRPQSLLKLEGGAALLFGLVLFGKLGQSWVLFVLLFFLPDLSIAAYKLNQQTGARVYNAVHTYFLPGVLGAFSLWMQSSLMLSLAAIWAAHIGFDRMLGWGLKHPDDFRHTHLGRIEMPLPGLVDEQTSQQSLPVESSAATRE